MAGLGQPRTGGGSRKGKPNKATAALKEMILEALDNAGGVEYLKQQAIDNPGAFLTLIGKVLPLNVGGELKLHGLAEILSNIGNRP